MTQYDQPPVSPAARPAGLAGLRKMSTTAGVGLQEYRALNAAAVASAVCGAAAWLALVHPLLLLVPAAAVLLGGLGLAQIRRSRHTQGGTAAAVFGAALGLGFGGYVLATDLSRTSDQSAARTQISALLAAFGDDMAGGDYRAAYDRTDAGFQDEFPFETFRASVAGLPLVRDGAGGLRFGNYVRGRSNGLAEVARDAATGRGTASAMLILDMENSQPIRQPVRLTRRPGGEGWRIAEFGEWFPRKSRD